MVAIKLWLRIEDVKKLKGKYKDNEAIEFSFDLLKDVPEDVAQEMVEKSSLHLLFFLFCFGFFYPSVTCLCCIAC